MAVGSKKRDSFESHPGCHVKALKVCSTPPVPSKTCIEQRKAQHTIVSPPYRPNRCTAMGVLHLIASDILPLCW